MLDETDKLKQKLEEMLTSNDTEWVNAVIVTLNAMYRQFGLEQQRRKQILAPATGGIPHPQVALICIRRSQSGPGLHIPELELVFLVLR